LPNKTFSLVLPEPLTHTHTHTNTSNNELNRFISEQSISVPEQRTSVFSF